MPFQLPAGVDQSSPQMKLYLEWTQAAHEMDVGNMEKHMHKDFRHVVYPRSIGHPEQNKVECLDDSRKHFGIATGFDAGHTPRYLNLPSPC